MSGEHGQGRKEKITGFSHRGQIGILGSGVAINMMCECVWERQRWSLILLTYKIFLTRWTHWCNDSLVLQKNLKISTKCTAKSEISHKTWLYVHITTDRMLPCVCVCVRVCVCVCVGVYVCVCERETCPQPTHSVFMLTFLYENILS